MIQVIEALIEGGGRYSTGRILICIRCGVVFARLWRRRGVYWLAENALCEHCSPAWADQIPGSLAELGDIHYDGHGCSDLPVELIAREVEVLVKDIDRATKPFYDDPKESTPQPTYTPMTPELSARIAELRGRVQLGTVTKEELIEAVKILRGHRRAAMERRAVVKAAKEKVDGGALLEKLRAFSSSKI